ncbi:MAG: hypothetical protein Q7R80_00225 [bacterium]|nr:hypothetical protein [bacterium]
MAEENRGHGATLLSWEFPEYEQHERGRGWYIAAGLIAAALLVYAFATKNFLFAVIVVMLAAVLYLRHTQAPQRLSFEIREKGILLADRFTPYDRLLHFWIVTEEGAPQTLYIHARGARPPFGVPLVDHEPAAVREAFRNRLAENDEEHEEPTSGVIGRALRL